MKSAWIVLAVAGGLVLAACGSQPEAEPVPPASEQGTAKGRLEMDTTDETSK